MRVAFGNDGYFETAGDGAMSKVNLDDWRALARRELKGKEPSASVGGLQLSRSQIAEQLELLRSQRAEIETAIAELEATLARLDA